MKGPFMEDNIHHASTSGLAMNRLSKNRPRALVPRGFSCRPTGKKKDRNGGNTVNRRSAVTPSGEVVWSAQIHLNTATA